MIEQTAPEVEHVTSFLDSQKSCYLIQEAMNDFLRKFSSDLSELRSLSQKCSTNEDYTKTITSTITTLELILKVT